MKYTPVPKEIFEPCDQPGTLERFHYASRGKRKDALVYLPWGYQDSTEEYPVLYLMHGGGGDSNEFFGGLEARTGMKNLLDNAIALLVADASTNAPAVTSLLQSAVSLF